MTKKLKKVSHVAALDFPLSSSLQEGSRNVVAFSILDMTLFSSSFYFLQFWLRFDDGLGSHGLSRCRSCRIYFRFHNHIYLFSFRIHISLSPPQYTHLHVFPSSFLHFSFSSATHSHSGIPFFLFVFLFLSLLCFFYYTFLLIHSSKINWRTTHAYAQLLTSINTILKVQNNIKIILINYKRGGSKLY